MSFDNVFDSISHGNHDPGFGYEIFKAWRRKESSDEEYHAMNAAFVADHLHWYKPRYYIAMPEASADYVRRRIAGQQEYDYPSAKKLGDWFAGIIQDRNENDANYSLLVWSKEKLDRVKLAEKADRIRRALDRYDQVHFPYSESKDTVRVKAMDAQARERMAVRKP